MEALAFFLEKIRPSWVVNITDVNRERDVCLSVDDKVKLIFEFVQNFPKNLSYITSLLSLDKRPGSIFSLKLAKLIFFTIILKMLKSIPKISFMRVAFTGVLVRIVTS